MNEPLETRIRVCKYSALVFKVVWRLKQSKVLVARSSGNVHILLDMVSRQNEFKCCGFASI